jgi:DNA-binding transcriptional LysR family regulator
MAHMELPQLRYFITLAKESHFGLATAREHVVQSRVSQQLTRLEGELGLLLLDRTIQHVQLTPARSALLVEKRQILAQVARAALATLAPQPAPNRRSCDGVVEAA